MSQVTGPEESAARLHMSPMPTFGVREFPLGGVRTARHPLSWGALPLRTPHFHKIVNEIVDVIAEVYVGISVDIYVDPCMYFRGTPLKPFHKKSDDEEGFF